MSGLITYVLGVWFFYFLTNYAAITRDFGLFLKEALGPQWGYPISCSFCGCFWITFVAYLGGLVPVAYVFAAPVLHLFVDLIYTRLSEPRGMVISTTSTSNSITHS